MSLGEELALSSNLHDAPRTWTSTKPPTISHMARRKSDLDDKLQAAQAAAQRVLNALAIGQGDAKASLADMEAAVLERVFRKLQAGEEIHDVKAYAKQVARRIYVDWHRQRARDKRYKPVDPPLMTPASLVVQNDDQRRHAADIQRALAGLSALDQAVVQLRDEGSSSAEIAELLGYKSAAVVDTKLSRIRRRLEHELPMSLVGPWLDHPGT